MQHQHHHLHARKRMYSKHLEPFPSKKRMVRAVDILVYVASIGSPILTVPQVIDIFVGQNAAGVSALSWGAYTLFTIPWLAYGIVHRERVLIANNSLWLGLNALIFVGAVIY